MLPSHVAEVNHWWAAGFSLHLLGTGGIQGASVLERADETSGRKEKKTRGEDHNVYLAVNGAESSSVGFITCN